MAKFTKQAIYASFLKLLNDRPLDQISVKDIVDDCGVNRKTFYYYYQDIYALIDDYFKNELDGVAKTLPDGLSWQDAQKALAAYLLNNRTVVLHIFRSLDYATLEQTAYNMGLQKISEILSAKSKDLDVGEDDVNLIAGLCASAMAGFLVRWCKGGMKSDPNDLIDRVAAVMQGTVELSLANAAALKKNGKKEK